MPAESNPVRILSIDGGGIRGIVPAMILAELQKRVGNTPLVNLFDLVAGTSTGGLIALGLTVPAADGTPRYTPQDMVNLYTEDGPRIFSRSFWYRLTSLGGLRRPRYPAAGLEAVLLEKFGSVPLRDALKEVLLTSYDLQHRQVLLFTRHRARQHPHHDYLMRDVARATSAAPSYFAPAMIRNRGGSTTIAVDGGVGANKPSLVSFVEALKLFPGREVLLVTLGTGKAVRPFPPRAALRWGILGWAGPISSVILDAQVSLVHEETIMLLPLGAGGKDQKFRFQASLDGAHEALDDASPANLAALQAVAQGLIDSRKDDLDRVARLLLAHG